MKMFKRFCCPIDYFPSRSGFGIDAWDMCKLLPNSSEILQVRRFQIRRINLWANFGSTGNSVALSDKAWVRFYQYMCRQDQCHDRDDDDDDDDDEVNLRELPRMPRKLSNMLWICCGYCNLSKARGSILRILKRMYFWSL
jgi:hypothetical protein